MVPSFRRSPLALAVLGVLAAGPMHPYGIQRRIREWGKDDVINVGQRSSLYKMIGRLEEAGLISVSGTDRDPSYPERTQYAVTAAGRETAAGWLAEMISTPRNEYPEFPAAISFLPMVTPAVATDLLTARRAALRAELDAAAVPAEGFGGDPLPRVVLLDDEYRRAVVVAELTWVDGVLAALADGSLRWSVGELVEFAERHST